MDHLFYKAIEFKHACALYVNKLIRLGYVNCEGVTLFETYSIESLQPNKSNWNFKGDEIPFCR